MGKVFEYLDISTGCITNNLDDHERKEIMHVILPMQQTMSSALTI